MIKAAYEYKSWKKGAKQIKMRIERDYGVIINLKKIRRLMKKYMLVCPLRKKNPVKAMMKAQQSHRIHRNVLNRDFLQGKAKKVLLTDITYFTYLTFGNGRRAYLSVIKEASTKMILSWQLLLTLDLTFVIDTVNDKPCPMSRTQNKRCYIKL
ncbi:IS3 family transposase [Thomasclavelia sp.]